MSTRNFSKSMLIVSFTLALIWACSEEANQVTNEIALSKSIAANAFENEPVSQQGITPYIIEIEGSGIYGDRDCDEVADAFELLDGFEFSSGPLTYSNGAFDGEWADGLTVNVTVANPDYPEWGGDLVEWSFTPPNGYCQLVNMAVIVKGVNDVANVYFYPNGDITSDSFLGPESNSYGSVPFDLENLTFCYNLEPCEEDKCYNCETAFGGDFDPDTKGAWWFAYNVSVGGEQTITAGQHMDAGTVKYADGKIMIDLADGWVLQDTERYDDCVEVLDIDENTIPYDEAVKIQGYNTLPDKRPAAGQFTTYKGMSLNPEVGEGFVYYVIHLDLLQEVECEEE